MVTSTELLELWPQSPLAHHTLAEHAAAAGRWEEALDHYVYLVLVCPKHVVAQALNHMLLRAAFQSAAGLAQEIRTNALPALGEAYRSEYGIALEAVPTGTTLAHLGAWERLLSLRELQMSRADAEEQLRLRREMAELLHRHLDRKDAAEAHYRAVMLADANDVPTRMRFGEILLEQKRWPELAQLQARISQLQHDPLAVMEQALGSATLYVTTVDDTGAATEVLREALDRPEVAQLASELFCRPDDHPSLRRLPTMLRRLGLHGPLAQLLETSLETAPDAQDGRF